MPRTLPLLFLVMACARQAPSTSPPPPESPPAGPGVAQDEFVSGEDEGPEAVADPDFGQVRFDKNYDADYAVTSPSEAHELAEAAVADQLNPKQTWKASPVLPTAWPTKAKEVTIYYYPLAANPASLKHYQLFSPAFRVRVSLTDGATDVAKLSKRRKLGTVVDRRPTVLEREELDLAERALVHTVLGGDAESGENNFWGYLKYFHEHPKVARDIKKRAPRFVQWLNRKK